nr:hypothetical protein [uncultured Bacteroides sp.]
MTRFIFSLLFCSVIACSVLGQNLKIKNIVISRVITKIENNVHEKDENKGPRAYFKIELENNTDTVLVLDPAHSKFMLQFRYNGLDYRRKVLSVFLSSFNEIKEIRLKPNEKYPVEFGIRIFSGTNLIKEKKSNKNSYDYSQEILKALPTLQLQYMDPDLRIISGKIENTEIEDYIYIQKKTTKH